MSEQDLETWCDEHLPDIYDVGLYDSEEIHDEVWEAFHALSQETVLDFIEDETERDDVSDRLTEIAQEWFRGHHDAILESIQARSPTEIAALCNKPQVSQHSTEWYAQRRNRLTASEFAQILDGRRGALLRQKLDQTAPSQDRGAAPVAIAQGDGEMNATSWGHRFEPIVRRLYEIEIAGLDTVNDRLGRFTHPTIPWLSASPDGLVTKGELTGRLVEIKSPKTRKPGQFVPEEYFVQMQIQIEVCDLDAVDFIEAQFAQRPTDNLSHEDLGAIEDAAWKGRIHVYGWLDSPETWTYRYSEPVEDLAEATMSDAPEGLPLLESSVWWLTGWFPRTVLRNRTWWEAIGWPAAELFWAQVESGRELQGDNDGSDTDVIRHVTVTSWMGR